MHQENAVNLQFLALNVAKYLEDHEDLDRAITAYNHIIAISDARADSADGENMRGMRNAQRDALLKKAALCESHGCTLEAIQALQRVDEEFPASSHARYIEARLNNRPIAEAEFMANKEKQAKSMLDHAFESATVEARIAGADVVIAGFPDTAASIMAMDRKARLLDDVKRVEEAEAAYIVLLDRLRPTASRSELFKTTRVRLKSLMAKTITTDLYAHQVPSEQRWAQFRAICNEIISQDTRPDEAAWTWVTLAESYAWQKQYEESFDLAEQFLAQHDVAEFPTQSVSARFIAGVSAKEIGRVDVSLTHLRWITGQSGHETLPDDGKKILVHAYYLIWDGLQQSQASPEAVSRAKEELNAKLPLINLQPLN